MRRNHDGMLVTLTIALAATSVGVLDADAQGVRGFEVLPGKLPIRGFGNPRGEESLRQQFPEAAAAIVGDDRSLARKQISLTDANGDGMVTQREWTESGFQSPTRFPNYDLNGDGILTVYEHSIGIARWRRGNERRADSQDSERLAAERLRNPATAPTAALLEPPKIDPQVAARAEQVQKLAGYVLRVHDINESRVIDRNEFRNPSSEFGNVSDADRNRDGEIHRDEIADWLQTRLPPLSRLALELQALDLNHDDQVTISEFANITDSKSVDEFGRWDRNGDGMITYGESLMPRNVASKYQNNDAFVIKPFASVVSDIWIEDEVQIDRLQVHVRLTKEYDNFTALHLVGPAGRRVTLFAGNGWRPWGGALILKEVTFSDSAPLFKVPPKQPPLRREVRPPGKGSEDDPTLDSFRGESSRGKWRLIVQNQNDHVGLLLHWSLIVTPKGASG